ncbi:MAG: ABC transporter substrate-binding protein [Pseudomonadota bacterium]
MDDYGIDIYGSGIYAKPGFVASNPDAVKGVVRAIIKGHQAAIKDPAAAIAGAEEARRADRRGARAAAPRHDQRSADRDRCDPRQGASAWSIRCGWRA